MLKELSWSLTEAVPLQVAIQIANEMRLFWSADLDSDMAQRLAGWAIQVWSVPSRPDFPVRALRHGVKVDGNVLMISAELDDLVLRELARAGGSIIVDIQCDTILDTSGRPVGASLTPVLTGNVDTLVPGGLLRAGLMVLPG